MRGAQGSLDLAAPASSARRLPASERSAANGRESLPVRSRSSDLPARTNAAVPSCLGPALAQMQPHLLSLALRITRDSDAAADVVQRTFLKVVLNARGFEGRSALRTWVWRIASNEALQWLRERSRDRRQLDALALAAASGLPSTSAANPSPLEELQRRRDHERIARALAKLSERDRELLEFFTTAERGAIDRLSAEIGVCARTIRTRLHRARQRLRQALASGN
jgi:RNA polymerase sigma-70 factor (ECF subfamily)